MNAMQARAAQVGVELPAPSSLRVSISRWENGHLCPHPAHEQLLRDVLEPSERQPADTGVASEGDSLFDLLTQHMESLRRLDRRLGAVNVRQSTSHYVGTLEAMWHSASGVDRRTIARVQADTASLAAWQDSDLGDVASAERHYVAADVAASRADSPVLAVHASAQHAVLLAESGRVRAALAKADSIERQSAGLPATMKSWLAATTAQVATHVPNAGPVALAALRRAEKYLNLADVEEARSIPFLFHDQVHLMRWTGHVLARLGDSGAERAIIDSMRAMPSDFSRARCGQRLDLVEAQLAARQPGEAGTTLAHAASEVEALGSVRLRRRHQLLARRVRPLPMAE
ncbi:hypothetical protein [Nocardia sp. NPDC057227]|uniref:hypothetical protein n=1 Tax=Nocardia sp. NPDC057227 TaxID=3346056 RepID=UPI00364472C7